LTGTEFSRSQRNHECRRRGRGGNGKQLAARSSEQAAGQHRYRADINGLRAIAIAPVVLYHAGFSALKGGFVGVDVFFVISGYLMASLILDAMERSHLQRHQFYERRIRRIFPALFVTIASSAVAAWAFLMPIDLAYFGRSVIASALFGSNILFWRRAVTSTPRLSSSRCFIPVTSGREQFYILFPLLLRAARQVGQAVDQCGAGGSPACVACSKRLAGCACPPVAAFYSSPSRCWELLLGRDIGDGGYSALQIADGHELFALLGVVLIGIAIFKL